MPSSSTGPHSTFPLSFAAETVQPKAPGGSTEMGLCFQAQTPVQILPVPLTHWVTVDELIHLPELQSSRL